MAAEKNIEIKSSLINSDDFAAVKNSIIDASKIDGKQNFRVKLIEYINDTSSGNNDMFFYDMLEFVRFLIPNSSKSKGHVAYTTPEKLIYMNAPNEMVDGGGESYRKWDFIYDHECLHQLWDTFGVEAKVEKEKGSCDHYIMNIASDCVINDYLSFYRKKDEPEGLINPQLLKDEFNVIYDRTKDTQYTLYMKLLEKKDDVHKNPVIGDMMKKLEPKSVEEVDVPSGGGPQGAGKKHSKDYIKGWTDGIKDATSDKVDPMQYSRKGKPKNDYEQGYDDVMAQMKKGLEQGIKIPKNAQPGESSQSDLPQIPWNVPPKDSEGNGDSDTSNGDGNSQKKCESAGDAQKQADEAKKNAKEAQDAADKAKTEASAKGDKESKEAAKEAQKNADEARKAARDAQDAADKAKKAAGKGDKETEKKEARHAEEAADRAKDAKERAKGQKASDAKDSNSSSEGDSDDSSDNNKSSKKSSPEAGKGTKEATFEKVDLDKIKAKAEKIIEKYKNKISGDFGKFIAQCKAALDMRPSGLSIGVSKGSASWKEKMDSSVNTFVKNKIFQKKREWQQTYSRVKRGSGFIKFGEPIQPGRKIKEQKLTINAAFYIDRSGSMGSGGNSPLGHATKAAYLLAESLKKQFSKEPVVDDVTFKMYGWDTEFYEIKWGNSISSGGGTMAFEELLNGVEKKTKEYLINIIITDAGFGGVNESEVQKFLKELGGLLVFITNNDNQSVKKIADKNKTNMTYILAPENYKF